MKKNRPIQSDATRLTRHFSALQPVLGAVQSAHSAEPACCLATVLRIRASRDPERDYTLVLPLQSHFPNETPQHPPLNLRQHVMKAELPAPVIQVLEGPEDGDEVRAKLLIMAAGPAECPPGQANEASVTVPGKGTQKKALPFENWSLPLHSSLNFLRLQRDPAALITALHPFATAQLKPKIWSVSVPGCKAVKRNATVAVFPDVRWQGSVKVQSAPDDTSAKGYRLALESTITCSYGADKWKLEAWEDAVKFCPWLGCVEMLARSASAISTLTRETRAHGLDNPRFEKTGQIKWETWPQCSLEVESFLREQTAHGLLGHRLAVKL